ncbi:MAG: hypothetical protein FD128_1186 [Hyphomonadaceae bacterium]|nr:MAG: hypothetical protein FD128_1186 [Hyphomonadaceae bacterium]
MFERDIQVGNMTREQQAELRQYANERMGEAMQGRGDVLRDAARRNAERFVERAGQHVDSGRDALNPANADNVSNRDFAEATARGAVNLGSDAIQAHRDMLRDLRPTIEATAPVMADIMRERERIINSNPNVSQAERANVRRDTERATRSISHVGQRLDEADFRMRTDEQRFREREEQIARDVERMSAGQPTGPTRTTVRPRSPVPPRTPSAPPPPTISPPPPPPSQSAAAPRAPVRRGTIPGQGNSNAGLLVPRSQGGTGPETAQSTAQASANSQSRARAEAQAQAERNAARLERNRQAAQDRADRDNAPNGGATNAALSASSSVSSAAAEANDRYEFLRRMNRMGRVGASQTGGSGEGSGGDLGGLPSLVAWQELPEVLTDDDIQNILDTLEYQRILNEQRRLTNAAQTRAAQDDRWNANVRERFASNEVFDLMHDHGPLQVLELEPIYRNYNPLNTIPPAQSLSSAGNSLSTFGFPYPDTRTGILYGFHDYRDPAVQSLNDVLYGRFSINSPFNGRDRRTIAQIANDSYNAGGFDVQRDQNGRWGDETGGYLAASLFSQGGYLHDTKVNGLGGLDALLAQPFNVILTWGANSYDLDLHMTGPLGEATSDRFHIYYAAVGNLASQPFAQLIKDCICNSGSEVILTSALNRGGVYRVSVFNFGDQAENSNNLSNASEARIQIVRGGTTQSVGNGTTIIGGRVILTTTVPNGQNGNTWVAVEINPKNGRITVPRAIMQSAGGSSGVR